ncbi:alpha-L-arabinofuranosidase [Mucilaginibacter sp. RS28]|uniref:Alpha-L-arabinofuranosidase n=1 Tax=Mucilaginibacter straminoryzae TaxID=2932774 RepID=A0A9X1X3G3_9SPHI|nr:alpha-L-arabinofuranosidase [Mucilaginibacter straminoryzae]MCJ8210502.1 alpha-L-arabinofuranosidase [Mucilaginibacter straminoryzae]
MNAHLNIKKAWLFFIGATLLFASCKKEDKLQPSDGGNPPPVVTNPGTPDPDAAITQGFFLNDWQPRHISILGYTDAAIPAGTADATVTIDVQNVITKVSPYVFGNNINTYMTQVVTEPVLMNNIAQLNPKILRAPGGSLADAFFWSAPDGQLPADVPAKFLDAQGNQIDPNYWYGKNTAPWTLSIDNYYKVLQQSNATGMITVNYAYARYGTSQNPVATAAHLAADWVRYDKGKTKFWEIGNENYGIWEAGYRIDKTLNKDGQPELLTGGLYGKHFKIFVDSMRKAATEVGTQIKIAAVLNNTDGTGGGVEIPNWNRDVLGEIGNAADFYVVHNYYSPYQENSTAAAILNTPVTVTKELMDYIINSTAAYPKPIALSEWNIQATGSNQNVSNIAGVHLAMTLGEVIKNKFGEASRFNLANNWLNGDDMGMFNIGDEPGAVKWQPRPAFYYQYYFRQFFGDRMVSTTMDTSTDVLAYGSSFSSGEAGIVLVNKGDAAKIISIKLRNFTAGNRYYYYVLNGGTETVFSRKVFINGKGPSRVSGGPDDFQQITPLSAITANGIKVTVPAYGAVYLLAEGK